jgi:hypothetical protein
MEMEDECDGVKDSGIAGHRRQPITTSRRKELLSLAVKLAEEIEARTKVHERCLLDRMLDNLVEGM